MKPTHNNQTPPNVDDGFQKIRHGCWIQGALGAVLFISLVMALARGGCDNNNVKKAIWQQQNQK